MIDRPTLGSRKLVSNVAERGGVVEEPFHGLLGRSFFLVIGAAFFGALAFLLQFVRIRVQWTQRIRLTFV